MYALEGRAALPSRAPGALTSESAFIESLRALATHPAARDLMDDVAVLALGEETIVLTHDVIVEGIHYLSDDPPEDVAWKLLAANLSDLAAKGAAPLGVLLGYALGEGAWDQAFARGFGTALAAFSIPLLGGDTVSMPRGAPRALGLTSIGRGQASVPSRSGAKPGDDLWVSGTIGDAGAGLEILQVPHEGPAGLVERYRNPRPRLEAGALLAPIVDAMMDVSDGLLIDAKRMAVASACAIEIALETIPLSNDYLAFRGQSRSARLDAATAGDDYELLFAAPRGEAATILRLADDAGLAMTRIGTFFAGAGLTLVEAGTPVALPLGLGFEHRT
jgi:thiamine-monophosphate kinase